MFIVDVAPQSVMDGMKPRRTCPVACLYWLSPLLPSVSYDGSTGVYRYAYSVSPGPCLSSTSYGECAGETGFTVGMLIVGARDPVRNGGRAAETTFPSAYLKWSPEPRLSAVSHGSRGDHPSSLAHKKCIKPWVASAAAGIMHNAVVCRQALRDKFIQITPESTEHEDGRLYVTCPQLPSHLVDDQVSPG